MPITGYVDTNIYIQKIDEASASVIYIGEALPSSSTSDAVWRIKKIVISGTTTTILYADGDTLFDNVWDDRSSLTYS